jgi:transposase
MSASARKRRTGAGQERCVWPNPCDSNSQAGGSNHRYELADHEWVAVKPMLPNKPRGDPRVNDRRVLNGIFWVLRSGAPWRDLPPAFGPYTTCYNRFVRWRRAGVWGRIIDALAAAHDVAVQMIDISTALATGWSGSSTGSNNVVGWRRATTGLPPTTLPSFNSRQSGYGCALMSPRPS